MNKRDGFSSWWKFAAAMLAGLTMSVAAQAAAIATPAEPAPAAETWIGLSRDEVVRVLGKPTSALNRGDVEVLVFADQSRVELRDNAVISFRHNATAVVIGADGKRYTPTAHGKLQRESAATTPPPPRPAPSRAATAEPGASSAESAPVAEASAVATEAEEQDADEKEIASLNAPPVTVPGDASSGPSMYPVEKFLENGGEEGKEPPPPSKATVLLAFAIEVGCRFGFCLLVLRIALHWMAVPFYWPDLVKVSVLYVVVRDGIHAIGGLGGAWELIRFFRVDDVVSFFALTLLLFHFKIALSGLTALKVAAATKAATYVVMIGVGMAIAFGLFAAA